MNAKQEAIFREVAQAIKEGAEEALKIVNGPDIVDQEEGEEPVTRLDWLCSWLDDLHDTARDAYYSVEEALESESE